jgi:hypothetical protein
MIESLRDDSDVYAILAFSNVPWPVTKRRSSRSTTAPSPGACTAGTTSASPRCGLAWRRTLTLDSACSSWFLLKGDADPCCRKNERGRYQD